MGGLAGDLHPFQNHCSLRDVESTVTGLSLGGGGGGKDEGGREAKRKLVESSTGLFFPWQDVTPY